MANQETKDPRDLPGIPWSVGAICAVCGNEMYGVHHLAPRALHRKSNEECHRSCSKRPCSLAGERPELPPCDPLAPRGGLVPWPTTVTLYLHGAPGEDWYWLDSFTTTAGSVVEVDTAAGGGFGSATPDELTEECASCGLELHATKGEHGKDGDDVEFPFWRFVYGFVATRYGVDGGSMCCRECVENESAFKFSVEVFEDGERN